jgi:LysM repeat protein
MKMLGKMFGMFLLLAAILAPAATAAPLYQQRVHVVQAGETLSDIADRYDTSVEAILSANDIADPGLIRANQQLAIPGVGEEETETQTEASASIHVIKPGETLTAIAAHHGISASALAEANGISNPSLIRSGQRLTIPPDSSSDPGDSSQPDTEADTYAVKPGDTLTQIAREHNTTVAALTTANAIADPSLLRAGQELVMPDDSAPPAPQVAPQGQLSMTVSISRQRCWVYQGETVIYNWPCSTARPGTVTKTGTFYVQSKIREAWGSTWGFWMPHWLGIYWAGGSENGIHGLPYRPGGYPIWAHAIGAPITYGCVLLGAQEARTLWEMAYIGMPVTIQP